MITQYIHFAKVKAIIEKTHTQHVSGIGKEAVFKTVSDGWWVILDSLLAMPLDTISPAPDELTEGDTVKIIMQKVTT